MLLLVWLHCRNRELLLHYQQNKHVFHFIMDECHNMIVAAKVFADAHKDKMPIEPVVDDDVEIEYDEDPSNDNNRL